MANDGREDFDMRIPTNTFCWQGIATDPERGPGFYHHVLGWRVSAEVEGPPMFVAAGGPVAHLESLDNAPPSWCSYLSVDDLERSTARAAEQGGRVMVPPTALPVGRFSMVATPSGAVCGLYEPDESDALAAPGVGSVRWVELRSTAIDDDLAWLESVFGFASQAPDTGGQPYHVLEAGGDMRGGVTRSDTGPSQFVAWVEIDDLDAAIERVTTHGGRTLGDAFAEPSTGRMAIVADPSGAVFGLVQPA